jgi:hypothetical protein
MQVGKAYGRTTYLSTTFQRVPRGTEGAVSVEGTLAGAAASALMAVLALLSGQVRAVLGGPRLAHTSFPDTPLVSAEHRESSDANNLARLRTAAPAVLGRGERR